LSSGDLKISDPSSTNGTWLDREKIGSRSIQIRYGQILTVGKVRLKLEGGL
jgi:pSer/pThr/pTyr-binding forkhead associated (FHA) protein